MMADNLKMCSFSTFIIWISLHFSAAHIRNNFDDALRQKLVYVKTFAHGSRLPLVRDSKSDSDILDIYCYVPDQQTKLSVTNIWTTVCFNFSLHSEASHYHFNTGPDEPSVYSQRTKSMAVGWWDWLSESNSKHICVSPFRKSCSGISTTQSYSIILNIDDNDLVLSSCFCGGVLLFLLAATLSRSVIFYYLAGICVGVFTSILITFIFLTRLLPAKYGLLTVSLAAGSGCSLTFWLLRLVWINLSVVVHTYCNVLLGYVILSAVASFAVCYYRGPITNPRLHNLIQWFLQAVALCLVYVGSQVPEFSGSIVVTLLMFQLFCWMCQNNKE